AFLVCLGLMVYTLSAHAFQHTVPGWASLFIGVLFIGAVQLVCVGLLGEYVGRIYTAVQNRPTYFIGHDTAADTAAGTASGGAARTAAVPSPAGSPGAPPTGSANAQAPVSQGPGRRS
ncbi:glycosyltransferase, partial [Streptomyces sp. NPDC005476]